MSKPNNKHKRTITPAFGAQPPRIRAPLRRAIDLIAIEGMKIGEAADKAGMNASALSRAINKPHIKTFIDEQKALYCLEADNLKGVAKAMAIRTGIDLMQNSPSHAVRARMVELFAGDGKKSGDINVQVNVDRGGYEFARPGQRIVEIREANEGGNDGATDVTSDVLDGQAIDNDDE